jgi:DNA polymerase-3 subunit gamma/tau
LARAADGSMRDGLSLLDQAIAFGGGEVKQRDVREMLGTIDQDAVQRLLQALAAGDARALLGVVADVSEHSSDYDAVLSELLLSLHQISLAQAEPVLLDERDGDAEMLLNHARSMTPEDVQLYYQIGLSGRRDLALAPDPRSGLEMILLRMLVFRPATSVQTNSNIAGSAVVTTQPATTPVATASTSTSADSWNNVVAQLKLSGLVGELASNCALESYENGEVVLVLDENFAQLQSKERETAVRDALESFYGVPVRLTMRVGTPATETPAQQKLRLQDTQKQAAMKAIYEDPNVKALQERFNARVNPDSVRSKV